MSLQASAASAPEPHRPATSPTILIVEDKLLLRIPVAEFLRDYGYRVVEASNAVEAQSIFLAGEPIDLMFADVCMPGGCSGIELANWVQDLFADTKIIMTSGITKFDAKAAALCQLRGVVQKPYMPEAVAEHIKTAIGSAATAAA